MPLFGQAKAQEPAQADPAKVQGRKMLRTLCKFLLPLIQSASGQKMDPKNVLFGIEADEFVAELENFISGVILRTQPRNQDVAIEVTLGTKSVSRSEEDPAHIPKNRRLIPHRAIPPSVPLGATEKDLGEKLQDLRKHVTQKMPIRLLCFEPQNSSLKISLFERADVYDYLALKLRADSNGTVIGDMDSWIEKRAGYAILSHTWNQTLGELTYGDWKKGSPISARPKYQKLVNFCKAAWEDHKLTLGWIDTVCINKESSAELDESIRSMYTWYAYASVCITYLAATNTLSDMRNDPWFTRGWTLQELLAPNQIKFYNKDWNPLSTSGNDDKRNPSIQAEIEFATTITFGEQVDINGASISRKMQLAAKRQVTRGEDIAYCLMGIFDVSISTAYGEGADRAFFRLVEEIFRSTKNVSDIFNWAGGCDLGCRKPSSSLFPFRPSDYLNRSSYQQLSPWRPIEPLTLTHLGLRTPILLMPAVPLLHQPVLPYPPPIGDYYAAVAIAPLTNSEGFNRSDLPKNYLLLDKRITGLEAVHSFKFWVMVIKLKLAFGTLNVQEHGTSIRISKTCFAVLLEQDVNASSPTYRRVNTENPIVFDLETTGDGDLKEYYQVERSELKNHGMELVTLYL